MSPRSQEYMASAIARLGTARAAIGSDPAGAVSAAYYAALYAARAALSEADRHGRPHSGIWHLFHEQFVAPGRFDRDLYRATSNLQHEREAVDDDAVAPPEIEARELLQIAERFVAAVEEMLDA